jgi:hypothetical protein
VRAPEAEIVLAVGLGVTSWVFSFRVARRTSVTLTSAHLLYWLAPLLLSTTLWALLLSYHAFAGGSDSPAPWVVFLLLGYAGQFNAYQYVFRCCSCGYTVTRWRVEWRKGVFRCPQCERVYLDGNPAP